MYLLFFTICFHYLIFRGHTEPAHLLAPIGMSGRVVSGTTANRLAVHSAYLAASDSANISSVMASDELSNVGGCGDANSSDGQPMAVHRLRSEAFKGALTSLVTLPLNRLLLLGSDSGNITLIC